VLIFFFFFFLFPQSGVRFKASVTGSAIGDGPAAYPGSVHTVRHSPDGVLVAAGGDDGVVTLFDMRTRGAVRRLGAGAASPSPVHDVAIDPSNGTVAVGLADSRALLYDVGSGGVLATLTHHTGACSSVDFSPAGRWLLTGSHDGTTALAALRDPQMAHVIQGHTGKVTRARWHPAGGHFATASADHTARLWRIPFESSR
jgi:WD40 repeat protein